MYVNLFLFWDGLDIDELERIGRMETIPESSTARKRRRDEENVPESEDNDEALPLGDHSASECHFHFE